jgi:two-component system, OmpR family, sensor histidine kinase CpxA
VNPASADRKISVPLSLKVAGWLLLNLVLLGALGLGVLAWEGGIGWDSLVRGGGGKRIQEVTAVIVSELTAATDVKARQTVLDRYGAAYGATFFAFHRTFDLAEPPQVLPPDVLARVDERPAGRGPLRDGPPDGFGPPGPPADIDEPGPPIGHDAQTGLSSTGGAPAHPPLPRDQSRGRFLVHTTSPSFYWLGARMPLSSAAGFRGEPATIVVRVNSWWSLMRLLDLQPWLLATAAVVVFSILFWLPFVHSITRHVRQLTTATGRIAEGDFQTRVETHRRDELGRLGEAVNTMAARLDTLVNGQKRFLGDVAHELGSPVGRLQVAVEILEERADPALRAQVADVREEVQQMAALINELLAFTKAGMRPRDAALESIELDPVIAQVIRREDPAARTQVTLDPNLVVRADATLLARAVGNLVRNALRYAGDSGAITVTARRVGNHVSIVIADEGPGVPAAALARLGEPFYRPETARTRETGGVGLGLAIVRSCVAACAGEVCFANRRPRGFSAEIDLVAS